MPFINRELSWLDFNERVLQLADQDGIPLLERVKFCAIFSSNLDEFFQVRVAALKDQVAAGITKPTPDGLSPAEALAAVSARVKDLAAQQEALLIDRLLPALAAEGIQACRWADLDDDDRKFLIGLYDQRIFPVLTPLAVDPAHPFPYVSGLALSLAVMVRDPATGEERFARVKVPTVFPRLVPLPDGKRFVPVEEVIEAQLPTLFSGMEIRNATSFRVTRNADLTLGEEEADDLLQAVEMELRRRRFGGAVRLEVEDTITPKMLNLLVTELDLEPDDVSYHRAPIDLTCLYQLAAVDRPELKDEPWQPVTAGRVVAAEDAERSFFSIIRERALLVHHPYESFASSAEAFLAEAADDPRVQSIKMTLYRPSDDSPVARSLIRAAERGVQVVALVELKARFDEATNVGWAKALERAGVHVVYGLVGLKTHSKCVLVVRNDTDGLRRYVHIGTGNYNSKTARLYEDLGYITCDPAIGADVTQLFNHLTGYSRDDRVPHAAGRAHAPAPPADRVDRERDEPRRGRRDRAQDELARRPEDGGAAVRSEPGRRADRPDHPRHLLPASRRAGREREHPGAQHRRPLPRAQPRLPLRQRSRPRRGAAPDRQRRPDAAQPRPPGRGADADRPSQAPGLGGSGAALRPRPATWCAGSWTRPASGIAAARRASSPIRSTCCTNGWPPARPAAADR